MDGLSQPKLFGGGQSQPPLFPEVAPIAPQSRTEPRPWLDLQVSMFCYLAVEAVDRRTGQPLTRLHTLCVLGSRGCRCVCHLSEQPHVHP